MTRLFLDANVFLYAVGGESSHRAPCRDLIEAVGGGQVAGVTNTEVLQEILYVRARRGTTNDAIDAVRAAATLVVEVLPVTKEDILVACDLFARHPKLGTRDALHAAVMRNASIQLIASVDTDFDVLKDLRRLRPKDALAFAR